MDSYSTNTATKSKEKSTRFTYKDLVDVHGFLKELNLQQYIPAFIEEGFESLSAIREITEEDLIALNVKRGHRRVIQRGIATLNGIPKTQPLLVVASPMINTTNTTTTTTAATAAAVAANTAANSNTKNPSAFTPIQSCSNLGRTSKSIDNNSSEGSAYTNSGYGSMGSPRRTSSTQPKYDSSNSSQYMSGGGGGGRGTNNTHHELMILDPPSSEQASSNDDTSNNNHSNKNMVLAENSRSSFSSNDDDEDDEDDADADGNMETPIKRKYRRHPKPDKNAPIKPPSAYIMFSNDARAQLKDHNMSFVEIAKLVGDQWKNLGINLKHQYERTAMRAKDQYIDALNAYRQTNEYKNYQTYLNNFKSEQDATNRKIARLRKKAKRESPSSGSMADSSSNAETNIKTRRSDASLGSSHSTDQDNPRSSSSSGSSDIYKVHLKNNPPHHNKGASSDENSSVVRNAPNHHHHHQHGNASSEDSSTTRQLSRQEMEEDNNGGECYSPQQNAPPFVNDSMVESNYHRLPFSDKTAAT
ncbi:hypothetical protein BD770DRAFT_383935 [Pilaira anomala]|nr:hypothetical protein BD770DRAFT_383935 [Pilaira anomala]